MSEQVESIAAPATGRAGNGARTLLIASVAVIVVIVSFARRIAGRPTPG